MERVTANRVFAVLLVAVGVATVAIAGYLMRDTFLGDPSIYLAYARNAAHGHLFSFNPGQFSSGSTSPLWGLFLSVPYIGGAGTGAAKAFSVLATVAAYLAVVVALRYVLPSATGAAIGSFYVVLAFALAGPVFYESPLIVALVAGSFAASGYAIRRAEAGGRLELGSLVPLALVWAALPLARPEAIVLVPIQVVALLTHPALRGGDTLRLLGGAVGLSMLPSIAYFGYSELALGTFSTSSAARAESLRESARHLGPLYLSNDAIEYVFSWPAVASFVPAAGGLAMLARRDEERWLAVQAGAGILAYVFLLTFVSPGLGATSRYLIPVSPLVAVGIAALVRELESRGLALVGAVAALALIVAPIVRDTLRTADLARDAGYTRDVILEREPAEIINRLAAPGQQVLAYEVQVRYFLRDDLDVLSLDGITDGKVLPYRRDSRLSAFLRRYKPRWWITGAPPPTGTPEFFRRSSLFGVLERFAADDGLTSVTRDGVRFTRIARRTSPLPVNFSGWGWVLRLDYRKEHATP